MSDYERKKSWREIDKMRDGSAHRKPKSDPTTRPKSTKRYKDSLDRLFDSGNMGKLMDKLETMGRVAPTQKSKKSGSKKKKTPIGGFIRKIKQAAGPDEVTTAIDELLEQYTLPGDDFEVLTQALDHNRNDIVLQALQMILELLEKAALTRRGALKMKLQLLQDSSQREIRVAASKILDKIK